MFWMGLAFYWSFQRSSVWGLRCVSWVGDYVLGLKIIEGVRRWGVDIVAFVYGSPSMYLRRLMWFCFYEHCWARLLATVRVLFAWFWVFSASQAVIRRQFVSRCSPFWALCVSGRLCYWVYKALTTTTSSWPCPLPMSGTCYAALSYRVSLTAV